MTAMKQNSRMLLGRLSSAVTVGTAASIVSWWVKRILLCDEYPSGVFDRRPNQSCKKSFRRIVFEISCTQRASQLHNNLGIGGRAAVDLSIPGSTITGLKVGRQGKNDAPRLGSMRLDASVYRNCIRGASDKNCGSHDQRTN